MALFVRLCDDYGAPVSSFQKSFFRNVVALAIAAVAWGRARAGRREDVRRETKDVLSLKSNPTFHVRLDGELFSRRNAA